MHMHARLDVLHSPFFLSLASFFRPVRRIGRPYAPASTTDSTSAHYSASSAPYRSAYPTPSATESSHQQYGRQSLQHDHPYQDQAHMQPSPQGRPPSLKINTAVRQSYPAQQQQHPSSSQRVSPQHTGSLLPLPQQGPPSSKASGRHYALPALSSSSAQSSPVTNLDYQSHIPPPLTPKDNDISPTSALSPAAGQNLKRKSIHHDAVMDAVRAKVLRNAGQSQQQREQLHKKASMDSAHRRRVQRQNSSPDRSKRAVESSNGNGASTMAGPKSKYGSATSPSRQYSFEGRSEGVPMPLSGSPASPSTPTSANIGSSRSRSSTPPSAAAAAVVAASRAPLGSVASTANRSPRQDGHNGYVRNSIRENHSDDAHSSGEDEKMAMKYEMDRTRPDRSSEIGVLAN
ncbi:hypothetical protein BC939DRAFT_238412 [Gamsiella multidivaricata]|uniref:uncharacterized protein n=1 Tax=Gamsiella multidivaricata TaxID=101098 RepID=UPI002220664F|nr:uncharacterized protein BC939DRAFT_238412 [Gamsiella multidivaricata]KAI7820315.1 hypothetical protein BC939DRAFT_238412 [Gamsiella multidivaricata]